MNQTNFTQTMEQASAFQKIWMESITKGMQAAFTVTPSSAPSDLMLQIRQGTFKALAQSWEEFMRSPQFLDGIEQSMEHLMSFRKMSRDFLGKAQNEMQAPSCEDIDTIMRTVQHMEKRVLDQVDALSTQVKALSDQVEKAAMRAAPSASSKPGVSPGRRAQTAQCETISI